MFVLEFLDGFTHHIELCKKKKNETLHFTVTIWIPFYCYNLDLAPLLNMNIDSQDHEFSEIRNKVGGVDRICTPLLTRFLCSDLKTFSNFYESPHVQGSRSTGDNFDGVPNIDHSQEFVRKDIIEWLRWLRTSVGFDDFRFDFAKGYAITIITSLILFFSMGRLLQTLLFCAVQIFSEVRERIHRAVKADFFCWRVLG